MSTIVFEGTRSSRSNASIYRWVRRALTHDLRDLDERCCKHRVYRLMRQEGLRAQVGYRRRVDCYSKPAVVAENKLKQKCDVEVPNQAWVTDITCIRTHEGWPYLAVVLDLLSRQVLEWTMRSWIDSELGDQCLAGGGLAAKSHGARDRLFGPGMPVQKPRMASLSESPWPGGQYQPTGKLL